LLVAGCVLIVAASGLGAWLLPEDALPQMSWIAVEAALGILGYSIGHIGLALTARFRSERRVGQVLNPWAVWKHGFKHLPATRWPVRFAVWGVTAIVCAVTLFLLINRFNSQPGPTNP
jgi:hypothetical protein